MAPRAVALTFALASLWLAAGALAQEPSSAPSAAFRAVPAARIAPGTTADSLSLAPDAAILPLRLSLLSSVYPLGPAFRGAGCSPEVGGTILPTQLYGYIPLTPRLVLHGFSDLGCPGDSTAGIDAGAGGGLTYVAPLRPDLWLAAGAGVYGVPGHGWVASTRQGIPPRAVSELRVDLVKKQDDGRSLSVGIGARGVLLPAPTARLVPTIGGSF
jgi:hypothetical protein